MHYFRPYFNPPPYEKSFRTNSRTPEFETCTLYSVRNLRNHLLCAVVVEQFISMIFPGKVSVALLASALPALCSSSHAARGEMGVVQQSMAHDRLSSSLPGCGWIVPTPLSLYMTSAAARLGPRRNRHHHGQRHTGAPAEKSSSNAPTEAKRMRSPRTASSVRSRPKSRRRSGFLNVAGVEGPSASAGAAAGTAAAATAAAAAAAAAAAVAAAAAELPAAAAAAAAATSCLLYTSPSPRD